MMRKKLPLGCSLEAHGFIKFSRNWRAAGTSAVAALMFGLASLDAHALALGRVDVLSAIGEPLRAEIDVTDVNAEEADSLRAAVASQDAYKSAGLEYNPVIAGVQISLQRRPDGTAFLALTGSRAVNDPFIELIIEAIWSSGRIVRDYTMLFDPPSLRAAPPVSPIQPQIPAARTGSATPQPAARAAPAPTVTPTPVAPPRAAASPKAAPIPAPVKAAAEKTMKDFKVA